MFFVSSLQAPAAVLNLSWSDPQTETVRLETILKTELMENIEELH